jgi:hypothetical protein
MPTYHSSVLKPRSRHWHSDGNRTTSRRLNLTRDQLAQFLTDQQQIRQFELLFSTVDELQVITGTDLEYQSANEALAGRQESAINCALLRTKQISIGTSRQSDQAGSFYDTTTQTATTINTAKAITFNNTDLSNGVYLGTPTSRVYVDTPGIYNFDTSFQLDKTAGGTGEFFFWFRLNGVDVPDSAGQIRIQGNNAEIFSSLNYFFDLKANDYIELMFSVTDLTVEIAAFPAAAPHPGIPSIILTVANNIEGVL